MKKLFISLSLIVATACASTEPRQTLSPAIQSASSSSQKKCSTPAICMKGKGCCVAGSPGCGDSPEGLSFIAELTDACRQKGHDCLVAVELDPATKQLRFQCGPYLQEATN